jgi:hypothetical protein
MTYLLFNFYKRHVAERARKARRIA